MNPPVVIPVNRLAKAKGRLAAALTAHERTRLALVTLETVVEAVALAGLHAVLLTPEPATLVRHGPWPADIRAEDPAHPGLNAQLEAAIAGMGEALILHADLPLASAVAIRAFVDAAAPAPSVTIVESTDGGTNAMLLRPPGLFPLAYGSASFAVHVAAAEGAGMTVTNVESPVLRLDLDTPADLAVLLESPAGRASRAGRFLIRVGLDGRLAAS